MKKREQILGWKTPESQEVEAFCYLTPFLRRFIPSRAELCGILLDREKPAKTTQTQLMVTATGGSSLRNSKPFQWTRAKEDAFALIKQSIAENAMAGPDCELQFHMAVDASKKAIGGVLFQLHGPPTGTEAGPEHRPTERTICFFSFKLTDAETRYSNSKREALAVARGLAEVKWMISASPHPTFIYTDHEALKTLLVGVDNDAHGRIANWQHRLGEYNLLLRHRSRKVHFMGIADGMSRLPT